ncbi:MAG: hypothetical protein ABFE01_18455 [Phycisphaerales bacterium]
MRGICVQGLLAIAAYFCLACGCSLGPVNMPAFSGDSTVRRIDPNDGPFFVIETQQRDPETGLMESERTIQWKDVVVRPNLRGERTFTMKYRNLSFDLSSKVATRIQLDDKHRYWALIDTGYPGDLYVNDAVVRDCDLAVFPLGVHPQTGCSLGVCEVPSLRIGPVAVANPLCWYEQRQWQFRVLGQPVYRDRTVLIGLRFLRVFSYVQFDNARREAVFGLYDAFDPKDSPQWVSLPFVLEETDGVIRMMVDVQIAEHTVHVEFDTGGARPGLVLHDSVWRDLGGAAGSAARYASYQFGWLSCRRVTVPELRVGSLVLKARSANVLAPDSLFLEGLDGSLSLDYFKATTVVLDFRKRRIWIRRF